MRPPPTTFDETRELRKTIQCQHRSLETMRRELDELRAERELFVGFLKTLRSPDVQDELTLRFSQMGFPGCGRDPD